jgi:hypothetical protein
MSAFTYQERQHSDPKFAAFIEGIRKYKLTDKQIEESGFYYAGGDHDEHAKYWDLRYPSKKDRPEHRSQCVCDVKIKKNCYITDDDEFFLVIGRCCIERFIPKDKQGRTCSSCKKPHKNRKDNLCNYCRGSHIQCDDCKVAIRRDDAKQWITLRLCEKCHHSKTHALCIVCNTEYYSSQIRNSMCYICKNTFENDHFNSYFMKDRHCGNAECKLCYSPEKNEN